MFKIETKFIGEWLEAGWTSNNEPVRFETRAEAEASIDEFIESSDEAYRNGMLAEQYNRDDFRVAEVLS